MKSFTTNKNGRFCNIFIRNLACHFIAEKFNICVNYANYNLIKKLGIDLYIGTNIYDKTIIITNSNYFEILNNDTLNCNIDLNRDYFQFQDLTDKIFNYLRINSIQEKIINSNIFKERYNNNNDIFIHIRLTDIKKYEVIGLDYYINCINKIKNYDKIYISTDEPEHYFIKFIMNEFNNVILNKYNEISTIQFGSTCKYVVLSHGSFSAVIGWLSYFSIVYFLNKEPIWCPLDMFLNKNWIGLD